MNFIKHKQRQSQSVVLQSVSVLGTVLAVISVVAIADTDLMQPVQDIEFQELPPPWSNQEIAPQKQPVALPENPAVLAPKLPLIPVPARVKPRDNQSEWQRLNERASAGQAQAQYELAMRYRYGNGVQKSRSIAHSWLEKSAKGGYAKAQYALAMFYQQYAKNTQGIKKSLLWLKRSADQGYKDAQYSLGMLFKNGTFVHANPQESNYWLQKAAQQGHVPAQLALDN